MEQQRLGSRLEREAQAPRQVARSKNKGSYNPPYAPPSYRILGPYAQTSSSRAPRELSGAAGSKAQSRQVGVLQPQAWLPDAPIPKMTNGDPIRRLENGPQHLRMFIADVEIAELRGDLQGRVPTGQPRSPKEAAGYP